jgi:hypothetical protein
VGSIKASIFIRLVDEFTVLHLRVLDMYHRADWYRRKLQEKQPRVLVDYPSIGSLWDDHHFEPRSGDPLLRLAERDIVARGLAHSEAMQRRPQSESFLSPLGKEFLVFISEPPDGEGVRNA